MVLIVPSGSIRRTVIVAPTDYTVRGEERVKRKGRRIDVYLIRRPFPFTKITRSALQSED